MSKQPTDDPPGPWLPIGLLLVAALAGCLTPGLDRAPADDGPPHVVTVETRYVPDGARNVSGPEGGDVNRLDPARLRNGTVATHPMWIGFRIWNGRNPADGREPSEARTGWTYGDACPDVSAHAPRRVQDNECDGHPMRSRHVLPPLYPQDRAENYSVEKMDRYGRGYWFSTANDSRSNPWNYTKGYRGTVPVDANGSLRLVFRHRVPIEFSVGGPGGEIPERMHEAVIEPENCTSDPGEPYDYVFAADSHVAETHGGVEPDPDGGALELHGDGRVVLEWSVLCRRDKNHIQY